MDDKDLRLDGNAACGLLNDVFPFEMTAAATTCSGCGAIKPVGELMLYGHGMGAILRFAELTSVRAMIETYPLEKAAEAYARMMSGDAQFRVVLTM